MIATLLLASVLHGGPAVRPFDPPASAGSNAPTVRLWLNDNGRYRSGDKAKVTVRSSDDGYLVVLNVDPGKRVRVLYPLNPGDDAFIRGGKKFDIAGRGGRETFQAGPRLGQGTVYAAVSAKPFHFDQYVDGNQWNVRALDAVHGSGDVEADLNDFASHISQANFDYDLLGYSVARRPAYTYAPWGFGYPYYGWGYPYYYPAFGSGVFFGLHVGHPFRRFDWDDRPFRRFR
ncbi:MAG: DUF4384 domain-containing protein [Deltaproteobacteria bacterium]